MGTRELDEAAASCPTTTVSSFGTFQGDDATRYSGAAAARIDAARASMVAADRSLGEVDPELVGEDALERDVGDLFERREHQLLAVLLELLRRTA